MRILIVIPAYNEALCLGALLSEISSVAAPAGATVEVLVVDDGSRDATRHVARVGGARVLRLSANLGIGGAVQSGLRVAFREGFDCAVQLDGDGQHPPEALATLLEHVRGPQPTDLLVGSRFLGGTDGFRSTWVRRLGIAWLRFVLRVITGTRVTDPTSGFRVYGRRALALFDDTYPYDFPEPEAIAVACASGLVVREAPVCMRERQAGRSSIAGFDAAYYMVKVTVAVLLAYARSRGRVAKAEVVA